MTKSIPTSACGLGREASSRNIGTLDTDVGLYNGCCIRMFPLVRCIGRLQPLVGRGQPLLSLSSAPFSKEMLDLLKLPIQFVIKVCLECFALLIYVVLNLGNLGSQVLNMLPLLGMVCLNSLFKFSHPVFNCLDTHTIGGFGVNLHCVGN